MGKQTPGPWKFVKKTIPGEFGWDFKIRSADETAICDVALMNEENAHLIAASPDLLSALEGIIGDQPDKWGYGAAHNALDDVKRKAAVLAILKARGQS